MIKLVNLTKKFGHFTAVKNISLEIPRGKIFAFLGTNGAGKTTTIKMMTGIIAPTSGTVVIGGYDIKKNPREAKAIMGVVPDRPYIYGKLTGREFLCFMADLYQVKPNIAENRIEDLLNYYSLAEWQNELVETYSHGMKQRILMCASQIHKPQVWIVDEPMVGLDPLGARLFKDTLQKKASDGVTIFMSTHSLAVAEEIADYLAIIKSGEITAVGTLDELFRNTHSSAESLENLFLELMDGENMH